MRLWSLSQHTTKDDERDRRSKGYGHIANEFFKPDDIFPSNQQLSKILTKSANKSRLQKSVLTYVRQEAAKYDKQVLYSVGQECINVATGQNHEEFHMDQAEADTIMLSICSVLQTLVIDSKKNVSKNYFPSLVK